MAESGKDYPSELDGLEPLRMTSPSTAEAVCATCGDAIRRQHGDEAGLFPSRWVHVSAHVKNPPHTAKPREEPEADAVAAARAEFDGLLENGIQVVAEGQNAGVVLASLKQAAATLIAAAEAPRVAELEAALHESATGRHYLSHTNQVADAAFTDYNICTFSVCIAARALVPSAEKEGGE